MMEAREVFQACQNVLGHDARATIHVNLEGSVSVRLQFNKRTTWDLRKCRLRIERDRLFKFSDYGGSQRAEEDAISRAGAFRANAARILSMVTVSRAILSRRCLAPLTLASL